MPHTPKTLTLRCTNRCNRSCFFCIGHKKSAGAPTPDMAPELVQTVLSCYPSIKAARVAGYGEATLNPHLPRIINLLFTRNIDTTIVTNGTRLTKLGRAIPWQRVQTCIAFGADNPDSYRDLKGVNEYCDTISGLEMLRALQAKVSVSFRVSRNTLEEQMTAFLEFARRYPDVPVAIEAIPNWKCGSHGGETPAQLREHVLFDDDCEARKTVLNMRARAIGMNVKIAAWPRFIRKNMPPAGICLLPFNHIAVGGTGSVRPCCNITQELGPAPNIYEKMVQSWYDKPMLELRKRVKRGGNLMPKACWTCTDR